MRTKSPDELSADALYDLRQAGDFSDGEAARDVFPSILAELDRLLAIEDDDALLAAIRAAGTWRWCGPIALDRFATDAREWIRLATAQALASAPQAADLPALFRLAVDPTAEVRSWAVLAIANVEEPNLREIGDCLVQAALDEHPETRGEALLGLVQRHDGRALGLLLRYFEDCSVVGTLAVEAARGLARPELYEPLRALREWWDVDLELLEEAIEACHPRSRKTRPRDV
jgi:HEAT repeat protein